MSINQPPGENSLNTSSVEYSRFVEQDPQLVEFIYRLAQEGIELKSSGLQILKPTDILHYPLAPKESEIDSLISNNLRVICAEFLYPSEENPKRSFGFIFTNTSLPKIGDANTPRTGSGTKDITQANRKIFETFGSLITKKVRRKIDSNSYIRIAGPMQQEAVLRLRKKNPNIPIYAAAVIVGIELSGMPEIYAHKYVGPFFEDIWGQFLLGDQIGLEMAVGPAKAWILGANGYKVIPVRIDLGRTGRKSKIVYENGLDFSVHSIKSSMDDGTSAKELIGEV